METEQKAMFLEISAFSDKSFENEVV